MIVLKPTAAILTTRRNFLCQSFPLSVCYSWKSHSTLQFQKSRREFTKKGTGKRKGVAHTRRKIFASMPSRPFCVSRSREWTLAINLVIRAILDFPIPRPRRLRPSLNAEDGKCWALPELYLSLDNDLTSVLSFGSKRALLASWWERAVKRENEPL